MNTIIKKHVWPRFDSPGDKAASALLEPMSQHEQADRVALHAWFNLCIANCPLQQMQTSTGREMCAGVLDMLNDEMQSLALDSLPLELSISMW